jgi:hypothetical protein
MKTDYVRNNTKCKIFALCVIQEYKTCNYFGVMTVGLEDPMLLLDDDDVPVVEHNTNNCPFEMRLQHVA